MPEGLQVALTLDQFADLIAFLESRQIDPRVPAVQNVPAGFISLFAPGSLAGWREFPTGTKRLDAVALSLGRPPEHWAARKLG